MPKLVEAEDGSETDPDAFKIRIVHFCQQHFAILINRSGHFVAPMKRSLRPFFSILLLVVFVATLVFRIAILRSFSFVSELEGDVLVPLSAPVFNATLLKYAAVDIGEAKLKQEIEQLLEGSLASQGRHRTFSSWRRFNHHDPRAKSSSGLQVMLRSPKFYRYWLDFRRNLHDWARKKIFQPDIMMNLVRQVKHPIDRHNGLVKGLDQRYSSCAVVGNSGILLNSEYGGLIDSHEMVIRLNNARTDRFERNVGSKTSLSFVNSNILHMCGRREGCFCHPYGKNVPMIMYICQPVHFLDYTVCNLSHDAPLLITDPRFDLLCARIVKYYSLKRFAEETGKSLDEWESSHEGAMFHYSSGMQAVMLALGICDKVSMFGFGKLASAKHHYHTNQKAELTLHDYEAEYAFYWDLVSNRHAVPFISDKFNIPPLVIYS